MGTECGAAGGFGLLLSNYNAMLGDVYQRFLEDVPEYVGILNNMPFYDVCSVEISEAQYQISDKWTPILRKRFREAGITVPRTAHLLYTESNEIRPFSCCTAGDDWILGFGLFTEPWYYPKMHTTFRNVAQWHTWVWAG